MAEPVSSSATPSATLLSGLSGLRIQRDGAGRARRRRRWPWIVAGLLLLGVAAALLMPRRPAVQVGTVQASHGAQQYVQLAASGYVVAQRRAAVSSKATGRLLELRVREGSTVKAGELIARLDASDVGAALAASEAGARQAEAALKQAEAALTQARAQQTQADEDLKRVRGLAAQSFVSPQAVDAAEARAATARSGTAAAQAALGTAQAAIGVARAQVRVQQVGRDSTEIRAPFDGVVLSKNANVGDLITPFSNASGTSGAVVTLADMATLEVEADVSESNVGKLKLEQPVEITLDALPGERFRGNVARIVPTVDRAKATVMTKVRFEKLDPRILPEMSAKVGFLSQSVTDEDFKPVLAVSPQALVERDGKPMLWRLGAGDTLEAVPVQRGRALGELVEVRGEGLKAGDRVVQSPAASLQAGAAVTVAASGAGR